ncbi:MAG: alkaline phosphatase family protein [Actinomycetota bacterium]|nr:alkaline phosphatase family protein [Actinomycetota bacterium]
MPSLVLGPILRYLGEREATLWVETDSGCRVSVLGASAPTFEVEGHHYALVHVTGLDPGAAHPYSVELDGECAWPAGSKFPPSVIRTLERSSRVRLVFGSCRIALPHEPPYTCPQAEDRRGHGIDALRALALRMAGAAPDTWPDALLMLGDQIYADDLSPTLLAATEGRTHRGSPRKELASFSEYALAYREAWSEPAIRWLLSTVPTMMVFDDHEIHAEWKISQAWADEIHSQPWYERRVTDGLMAYWLYQHLGNLTPEELAHSELFARVRGAGDAGSVLRGFARDADRQAGASRWSFCRDLGSSRLVVIDSRAGRELTPGRRRMIGEAEWEWIERQASGDFDHLLLASSVPFLLGHALHYLEAWNEAVCDGAWGALAARLGERIRRAAVLDHWASFQHSFRRLAELLRAVVGGELGRPPDSVVLLSGDVHHSYLAEIGFPAGTRSQGAAWQAVCSPYRKELRTREKLSMRFGNSRTGAAIGRLLDRLVGVPQPSIGWRLAEDPSYENHVATLDLGPGEVVLSVETTAGSGWRAPRLRTEFERRLV